MASLTTGETKTKPEIISTEDQEEQQDELEALQSIYPELNTLSNSPPFFELAIDVNLSGQTPVLHNHSPTSLTITYVPPIVLRVKFCSGYPSLRMPILDLDSIWLDETQTQQLLHILNEVWTEEYEGGPAVYGFIDKLSSDETYVDLVKCINVQDEATLPILLRYNGMKSNECFQAATHTCPVCYDDLLGSTFVQMNHCSHYYCQTCFKEYIEHSIGTGAVDNLTCLDSSCTEPITMQQITQGTNKETADRFERIQLQKTLDGMADIVWCPKNTCATPCIEDSDNLAECPQCRFAFCTICYNNWHPGVQCVSAEVRIRMMQAKNNRTRMLQSRQEKEEQLKLLHEQMSLAVIEKSTNQCPSCKMAVAKSAGCNKMTCSCGTKFCNQCNEDITDIGYEHFYNGACDLFDQEALTAWNKEMGNMGRNVAVRGNQGGDFSIGEKCPRCRQMNAKGVDGSNRLLCWACNTPYCYLCRSVVTKGKFAKNHFGKGGCPQHGDKKK